MRKFISVSMLLLLIFTGVGPVMAHDGWSQTNTPIIEPGENSYVELQFGNHSNDHRSYRIEGMWNVDDTELNITTPDGDVVDISDSLFYMGETGEDVNEEVVGVNNYHVGSFSADDEGMYIVSADRDSIFDSGDTASRTLRSAKSFVAVSKVPAVSAVQDFEGYDRQVTPDRAELVPQFNPVAITPDEEVSIQLLKEGEPLADEEVSIVRRSTSEADTFTTDEDGLITFTTGPADYYLLRAMPETDESVEGEYDSINYEATMTFTVQNGKGLSVAEMSEDVLSENTAIEDSDPSDSMLEGENESFLFQNPFFYVSVVLGLGFLGTLIALLRK